MEPQKLNAKCANGCFATPESLTPKGMPEQAISTAELNIDELYFLFRETRRKHPPRE